jgi:hypothetical protein
MKTSHLISLGLAVLAALVLVPASYAVDPEPQPYEEAYKIDNGIREVARRSGVPLAPDPGGGGGCWGKELVRGKGTYPYGRRLFLYTVWCGSGGLITYRSSSVRTDHDFLCWNSSGPYVAKTAGGAGWTWVQVQAWVDVACHSPWWFDWHDSLMMRVNYYPNGVYETVAYS